MFGKLNTRRTHEQAGSSHMQGYAQSPSTRAPRKTPQLLPELVYDINTAKPTISKADTEVKDLITKALYDTLDTAKMRGMTRDNAQIDIADIIADIVKIRGIRISPEEQKSLAEDICHDLLGFGPLEKLLLQNDIRGIIVNGSKDIFVETNGLIEKTDFNFRDDAHLVSICQRLANQARQQVDQNNPIWNFRLDDGTHVNVLLPPLSFKGPVLTIRKTETDKLALRDLVDQGAISPAGARLLAIIAASQCNILISGGKASGKTTLLNGLASFIHPSERIVTCETLAELQLRQPHVVSLETNGTNFGETPVRMEDLIRNSLLIKPERIIVGELRGPEAMDLLQAMNTGHDGSMGTLHANTPSDAIARLEAMVTMSAASLPPRIIRQMIVSAVDIIVQIKRMRDGSRKITHITEVLRLERDVVITQDLMTFEFKGEDENGKITGRHKSGSIAKPRFWDRAQYFGLTERLSEALIELGGPDFRSLSEGEEPTLR